MLEYVLYTFLFKHFQTFQIFNRYTKYRGCHNITFLCVCALSLFNPCDWLMRFMKVILLASNWSESLYSPNLYEGQTGARFSCVQRGLPNCCFYNNFELILQSSIRPKIYNLQYTCKIWLKSTILKIYKLLARKNAV